MRFVLGWEKTSIIRLKMPLKEITHNNRHPVSKSWLRPYIVYSTNRVVSQFRVMLWHALAIAQWYGPIRPSDDDNDHYYDRPTDRLPADDVITSKMLTQLHSGRCLGAGPTTPTPRSLILSSSDGCESSQRALHAYSLNTRLVIPPTHHSNPTCAYLIT